MTSVWNFCCWVPHVPPRETSLSGDERGETSAVGRLDCTMQADPFSVGRKWNRRHLHSGYESLNIQCLCAFPVQSMFVYKALIFKRTVEKSIINWHLNYQQREKPIFTDVIIIIAIIFMNTEHKWSEELLYLFSLQKSRPLEYLCCELQKLECLVFLPTTKGEVLYQSLAKKP